MLTKDLLRFQVRGDRAHPSFVRPDDPSALALADEMIAALGDATGSTIGEAEESLAGFGPSHRLAPAFQKLLLDRVDEEEDDGSIAERRAQWILAAQKLRHESARAGSPLSLDDFRQRLGDTLGLEFFEIGDGLYADLPQARRVTDFKSTTAPQLIHRYNCALVQGLLLRAREVTITIGDSTITQRRRLFRMIKFNRLLCEFVNPDGAACRLRLSGPLSLFQNASAYGLRLAVFFPHLLHMPRWQLDADLNIRDRTVSLRLDQSVAIQSHYEERGGYVPEEFRAFIDAFNRPDNVWRADEAETVLPLGAENYCVPDIRLTGPNGQVLHIELFHKWHASQLAHRLSAAAKFSPKGLLIGIAAPLAKDPTIAPQLAASDWFARNGFEFRDFPTPRAVLAILNDGTRGLV